MGTDYHYVPSSAKLLNNSSENDNDYDLDDLINGDYKNLSRQNSSKDSNKQTENKATSRVIRRFRTNSFNQTQNDTKPLDKQNVNSDSKTDLKSSIKKLFSSSVQTKQKLSPASSLNRKKRSYSHSLSTNNGNESDEGYANSKYIDQEENDEEEDEENEYNEHMTTTKPLLINRANTKLEEATILTRPVYINEGALPSSDSNSTYTQMSDRCTPNSSASSASSSPTNIGNNLVNTKLDVDENNNKNLKDNFKVIILDNKTVLAAANVKRVDSVRMRHMSNTTNTLEYLDNSQSSIYKSTTINDSCKTSKQISRSVSYKKANRNKFNDYLCIAILFVVNLLNYIDRFTLAGMIFEKYQKYFFFQILVLFSKKFSQVLVWDFLM